VTIPDVVRRKRRKRRASGRSHSVPRPACGGAMLTLLRVRRVARLRRRPKLDGASRPLRSAGSWQPSFRLSSRGQFTIESRSLDVGRTWNLGKQRDWSRISSRALQGVVKEAKNTNSRGVARSQTRRCILMGATQSNRAASSSRTTRCLKEGGYPPAVRADNQLNSENRQLN
jgi:hypothetical protein